MCDHNADVTKNEKTLISSTESIKNISPCIVCEKKSIYNMQCRCSATLCKRHWKPEKHNCTFDFSAHANNQNTDRLQKIEAQKIDAI